jgi:hypothetical protein
MAATQLGTNGVFAMSSQTGFIIQSQSDAFEVEQRITVDHTGEKVGITLYGDQRKITIEGLVPTSSAFSTRMAALVTLANSPGDFYRSSASAGYGDTVHLGTTQTKNNEDFHRFSTQLWASPFADLGA